MHARSIHSIFARLRDPERGFYAFDKLFTILYNLKCRTSYYITKRYDVLSLL